VSYETIIYEVADDRVATITLNRPEVLKRVRPDVRGAAARGTSSSRRL
jgi:1,4-dihydroxy-2-naphthoyl-CoA synthase